MSGSSAATAKATTPEAKSMKVDDKKVLIVSKTTFVGSQMPQPQRKDSTGYKAESLIASKPTDDNQKMIQSQATQLQRQPSDKVNPSSSVIIEKQQQHR